MTTREDVDKFAAQRPFQPFEVRLVDGHRHRFTKVSKKAAFPYMSLPRSRTDRSAPVRRP